MKTAGWSTRRVARQVERSECAVRTCWEQWTRDGTYVRHTGSGATRKTTRREERRIVWQALVDPTVTRSTTQSDVGVPVVPQTISRRLAEANLQSKRPVRVLPLTPKHRRLRLQWCHARATWNGTDWQNVVFSDESRIVLGTDDNRIRVWRRPGERCNSTHVVTRHIARTGGVMVWGAITYASRSTLIVTLPWPARSPKLSPIEHVWDQLKRQMPLRYSVHDLEVAVQDLWVHLLQDYIRRLINTMPNRVAACIAAGGSPKSS
ncbi:hypothetical protein AVEN_66299-1 [Araneus ventricosus]|uniref:Transposase Tc1-like domain-containing protein n=1 Tax=Araneus ventricosus TaxID=182803 RepID=A0A4Y2WT73_ARAVE|nr:hypothetical protein AVEN_66299-1 [Araneus ventricosus]